MTKLTEDELKRGIALRAEIEGIIESTTSDVSTKGLIKLMDKFEEFVTSREQPLKRSILAEAMERGPKNKYTLDEVAEANKHLDSRTQQSALDRSRGMIETNEQWRSALQAMMDEEGNNE